MKFTFTKRLTAAILLLVIFLSLFTGCQKPIIDLDSIPEYSGEAYVEINGNMPFFKKSELTTEGFESYSELDALGRCGVAYACIGLETMPTAEREDIASVTPSGWEYNGISNNNTYDFVENEYVYNRCHLIAHRLAGEDANEKNLITGTRYMNIEGMLTFEAIVSEYVEKTGNHVMYRVTPIFEGVEYVARGVLMEAYSVEDSGRGVCFCIFAYNVQPGVTIDYFSGVNVANGEPLPEIEPPKEPEGPNEDESAPHPNDGVVMDYILNTKSKKFHTPGERCANSIGEINREEYNGTRNDLIKEGYSACGICKP